MTEYKSPQVSCIICKKVTSSKGIHSHYRISHTEAGAEKHKHSSKAGIDVMKSNKKIYEENRRNLKNDEYNSSPSYCVYCNSVLSYSKRFNRYCSRKCAGLNQPKTMRTEEQKLKISLSLKKYNENNSDIKRPKRMNYCRVSFCEICSNIIPNKHAKTCSRDCYLQLQSSITLEKIKKNKRSNYRRDKKSYLESSFEDWLLLNNIKSKYIPEYTIKNNDTGKWYFVDFYFPEINLIIELDGKQHEKPAHKEADKIRDEYIQKKLNIKVFRISHSEYIQGTKIEKLLSILV